MIKLILPILFPSWRFFSAIDASPRIQFAFLENEIAEPHLWYEFRPRPARISFIESLCRLLWNPRWNETLYLNTCAEHLLDEYSVMREQEILNRILSAVSEGEITLDPNTHFLLFRISTVIRENKLVTQPVMFISKPSAFIGGEV